MIGVIIGFVIGIFVGGGVGILTMALMQVNRRT